MEQHTAAMTAYILDTVCEDCGQCCSYCPAKIDIPEMLKLYGRCTDRKELLEGLQTLEDSTIQPIDCIECGACTAHCPKKIQVKQIMQELAMLQTSRRKSALCTSKEV